MVTRDQQNEWETNSGRGSPGTGCGMRARRSCFGRLVWLTVFINTGILVNHMPSRGGGYTKLEWYLLNRSLSNSKVYQKYCWMSLWLSIPKRVVLRRVKTVDDVSSSWDRSRKMVQFFNYSPFRWRVMLLKECQIVWHVNNIKGCLEVGGIGKSLISQQYLEL